MVAMILWRFIAELCGGDDGVVNNGGDDGGAGSVDGVDGDQVSLTLALTLTLTIRLA